MKVKFVPNIRTVDKLPGLVATKEITHEPMLFSCDFAFAEAHGGPLTKSFLFYLAETNAFHQASQRGTNLVIDSRCTMTMEGSYPSIPGWHCDDCPRSEKYAQPDIVNGFRDDITHFMMIQSDTLNHTCTEFICESITVNLDPHRVWGSLDDNINKDLYTRSWWRFGKKLSTRLISPGEIVQFNNQAIHRASPTKSPGWRFFIRASFTYRKPVNELRKQVQIYTPINGGW